VLAAYEKGTRSFDGTPGEKYWQNFSEYKIKVSVEPKTRLVKGQEVITYYINSPDSLYEIVFNIIQDLNKPETERNREISEEAITSGVDIERFAINDSDIVITDNEYFLRENTLLTLTLDHPAPPNSTINFEIDWNFIIPKGKNPRMGTYDSTSFLIAYWFPQVAVYDDIDGWDKLAHNGEQEFYNDFSNFDVEIIVPNTFGVWATGILQNPDEVLTPEYLNRYEEAHISDEIINIVTKNEVRSGKIYKSESEFNTWKYKAENVTDFTFGISDHYLWDAGSLVVDEDTDRRTYVAAVYKEESEDFYEVADIAKKAIGYFSNTLPAVPFPFPSLTIFNGSGGMEFPMMINDGSELRRARTVDVTSHETAHQYMPFYVGINEEKYSWMEEGMAEFLPFDFQREEGEYFPRIRIVIGYERFAGEEMEMPMMIPYDFFFTFNEVTGKDLSWYWKPWFFERGYPDLAIKNASYDNGKLEIEIEKVGIIPIPVNLVVTCKDYSRIEIYENAAVWEKGNNILKIERESESKPLSIVLGSDFIPDSNEKNNYFVFVTSTH
jgi:hypothetical protein